MDDAGQAAEFALLAAPLPGDAPAGADLRQDFSPQSLYYRLRDARAEAREMERRIDTDAPDAESGVPAQWRTVRELAAKALAEQTKDLEIAAWLTEALVRQNGLAGMAAGAGLMAELAATLWDGGLYPQPDEDGIETRVAPVAGLNGQGGDGTLMQPLRKCLLFVMPDGTPITYFDYLQSEEVEKITDAKRRKQRQEGGKVTPFEELVKCARISGPACGPEHFSVVRQNARAALAAWTALGALLDERAGPDAPSTTQVQVLIASILEIAQRFAPPEREDAPTEAPPETPSTDAEAAPAAGASGAAIAAAAAAAARPVTRDDMLRELERIAEFFRRTEPHSPLSYTLEEAIRRARLTWPELLQEVVPDGGARSAMLVMLGIRPSRDTENKE